MIGLAAFIFFGGAPPPSAAVTGEGTVPHKIEEKCGEALSALL